MAEKIVQGLLSHGGLEAHDYSHELQPLQPNIPEVKEHGVHEAFHPYIMTASELAPHGNQPMMPQQPPQDDLVSYAQELQRRRGELPPTAPPAPVQPTLRTRTATSEEAQVRDRLQGYTPADIEGVGYSPMRAQQLIAGTQPGQTYFDLSNPQDPSLVLRSEKDVRDAISNVQKAMEKIQIREAMEESEIKKYLPSTPLSNPLDIGLFAKSINLTSNDVWAIHTTKGDWEQVARDWQVSIKLVKAVKVAMGGYRG